MREPDEHNIAIVLSAGKGSRMHSDIPKQYMDLCGHPVLWYSLHAFEACSSIHEIILVADEEWIEHCRTNIVEAEGFHKVSAIIPGGRQRYDSVYLGLKQTEQAGRRKADFILIHDGARPHVNEEIIRRNLETARSYGTAITGMPVKDTIKRCDSTGTVLETPDRRTLWQVQTPQTFAGEVICAAYQKLYTLELDKVTDDAMVVELALGNPVHMVEGSYENMKITTPEDLKIAAAFLNR